MKNILFILDRAHGKDTKGKSSPDGRFKEWIWSDIFVDDLSKELTKLNIPWIETNDTDYEIGLTNRVKKGNFLSENYEHRVLLSFHNNAGGGSGIELFTSPGEDESDEIAKIIAENLIKDFPECKWRRALPDELDKESKFTVIAGNKYVKPKYWGVLIEFLFMDNNEDLTKLRNPEYTKRFKESILYSIFMLCERYGYKDFKSY